MLTRCLTVMSCAAAVVAAALLAVSPAEHAAVQAQAGDVPVKISALTSWGWD